MRQKTIVNRVYKADLSKRFYETNFHFQKAYEKGRPRGRPFSKAGTYVLSLEEGS
jgi:hypothetical protein